MTEATGSLGEEAAKLVEALSDWARSTGFDDGSRSISDGSTACGLCPLCQLIALLGQARPETFAHLLDASASLTAAIRSLAEHAAESAPHGGRRGVERIDLDPPRAAPA